MDHAASFRALPSAGTSAAAGQHGGGRELELRPRLQDLAGRAVAALTSAGLDKAVAIGRNAGGAVMITVTEPDPPAHAWLLAAACCELLDTARLNARILRATSPRASDHTEVLPGPPAPVPAAGEVRAFLERRFGVPGLVTTAAVQAVRAYWTADDTTSP